jgi:hypothetical protein
MNKKYDNNNIIIASRAYFLHLHIYTVGQGTDEIAKAAAPPLPSRHRLQSGRCASIPLSAAAALDMRSPRRGQHDMLLWPTEAALPRRRARDFKRRHRVPGLKRDHHRVRAFDHRRSPPREITMDMLQTSKSRHQQATKADATTEQNKILREKRRCF